MPMKRIVTESQAEQNTWRRAQGAADVLNAGPDKVKAQATADDMKVKINDRNDQGDNQQ